MVTLNVAAVPSINCDEVERKIIRFLKREAGHRGVVLGLSGGIDSATVAALSVEALGKQKVLALIMPEDGSTPREDSDDAISYAEELGISYRIVNITNATRCVISSVASGENRVAEGNIKARIRMLTLYYFANSECRIVVGSGDRSELLIGYFTKYGDGGADVLPIGGLYKTQVRQLAKSIGIPSRIISKKSSPCLWDGQTAEGELGIDYDQLDIILHMLVDRKMKREEIADQLGEGGDALVDKIKERIDNNAHKLRTPPIPKI
ncbi:MAG TPA: NAD+ synthase [Candidatus Methanomethylicus sp.]|nr:NAD+ synthase [Candidatus Methanomethylicus sp.]